jgi:hypothetical protein
MVDGGWWMVDGGRTAAARPSSDDSQPMESRRRSFAELDAAIIEFAARLCTLK